MIEESKTPTQTKFTNKFSNSYINILVSPKQSNSNLANEFKKKKNLWK